MTRPTEERGVEALRRRAERALDEGRGRKVVEPLLERLLSAAPEGDPARLFAHRHLAELRLEIDPWSAALHLRKVVEAQPDDDVAHSLMALAQALLGNYRSSVAAYRRALRLAPHNPWYHHNLGHLLDVALDAPRDALPHLERALANAAPPEHEITASAAHCLARVGRLDDALELAKEAVAAAPDNRDHAALRTWIEDGAPIDRPVHPLRVDGGSTSPRAGEGRADPVEKLLELHMGEAGLSPDQLARARALWSDYRDGRRMRVKKPEVCAAAVHYAIALVNRVGGVTQASIARRYGVAAKSVSSRYGDIRQALALRPGDPRYEARA